MKKELKDYLHLYLGCECTTPGWGKANIVGIDNSDKKDPVIVKFKTKGLHGGHRADAFPYNEIKPILRPLSSMTEEESDYILPEAYDGKPTIIVNAAMTVWLLSKRFDLFGLIKAGIAIDSTTIKK